MTDFTKSVSLPSDKSKLTSEDYARLGEEVLHSGVARGGGGGAGGASAPGRRPEGGAKILPKIKKKIYIRRNFNNSERKKIKCSHFFL